jgi:two-component system, OmpR family, response regulator RegX3
MTTTANVLIVSRDKTTARWCLTQLRARGYAVAIAANLRQCLTQTRAQHLDAIVVDLTSLQSEPDRIRSQLCSHSLASLVFIVRAGAKLDGLTEHDATVRKPIAARQLVATVKSAIARKQTHELARGPFRLDLETRVLTFGKKHFHLMKKEFAVLKLLLEHAGELVTRQMLMREVWETDVMGDTRLIDVYMCWLREKVEDQPNQPQHLLTVRGQGYRFQTERETPR